MCCASRVKRAAKQRVSVTGANRGGVGKPQTSQEEAKRILERFGVAIPMERMDIRVWQVLKTVFGWTVTGGGLKKNKAASSHTEGTVNGLRRREREKYEKLVGLNSLDIELHAWVKERFSKHWDAILGKALER